MPSKRYIFVKIGKKKARKNGFLAPQGPKNRKNRAQTFAPPHSSARKEKKEKKGTGNEPSKRKEKNFFLALAKKIFFRRSALFALAKKGCVFWIF